MSDYLGHHPFARSVDKNRILCSFKLNHVAGLILGGASCYMW